jgi:hypothetical protein
MLASVALCIVHPINNSRPADLFGKARGRRQGKDGSIAKMACETIRMSKGAKNA